VGSSGPGKLGSAARTGGIVVPRTTIGSMCAAQPNDNRYIPVVVVIERESQQ
jgi:hypothetical protein